MTKQKNFTARSEINIGQQLSINPSTYRRSKEIARHRSESSLNKSINQIIEKHLIMMR